MVSSIPFVRLQNVNNQNKNKYKNYADEMNQSHCMKIEKSSSKLIKSAQFR